jgi:hypothetical protein
MFTEESLAGSQFHNRSGIFSMTPEFSEDAALVSQKSIDPFEVPSASNGPWIRRIHRIKDFRREMTMMHDCS